MRPFGNAASRRLLLAVLIALLAGCDARAAGSPVPPYDRAEYWTLADRMMTGLDYRWNEARRAYVSGGATASVRENSAMLVAHAIAALDGHTGPTRRDARARALADRLSATPAWLGGRSVRYGGGAKSTCWGLDLDRSRRAHPSLESKVAAALALAWRARGTLQLPTGIVRRIEARVSACAGSPAWNRGPRVHNQINWNAELYASAATVSGRRAPLTIAYRRQLAAFAGGVTRPMAGERSANLGRNYQFHYRPREPRSAGVNLDSPEYANITVDSLSHYDRALGLGMRPLPALARTRFRAWVTRLLSGSWTHAGYLNWDTGHGVKRWHSAQYWAWSQQGLLTIATASRFRTAREGAWAKALFDRGLQLHRRLAGGDDGALPPLRMFGVRSLAESRYTYHARMLANIARAVEAGLGSLPAEDPPPLYSFDYDTGRLAVTTPRYSTAIVPDNRGVFAYGGIEPARLFGPRQAVAAGVGGTPPAALGVVVSDRRGRTILASQHTRAGRLRVTRSPHGTPLRPRPYPARPYAGPFADLRADGVVSAGAVRIRSTHRFTHDAIETRWKVTCGGRCAHHRIRAHFPTWGEHAVVDAVDADGQRSRLAGATGRSLASMARFVLGGPQGGYRLTLLGAPSDATLTVVPTRPSPTNPTPGPSLAIDFAGEGRSTTRELAVRVETTG